MTNYIDRIKREVEESVAVSAQLLGPATIQIAEASTLILKCLRSAGKLIVFGNGGSAAEAQHFVAELVGRYRVDRQALAAVALTSESASLTAIANDLGFEQIFSRQLQALGRPGDVAFAISTSGNSPNITTALRSARTLGLTTIGLTGKTGGQLAPLVDVCLNAPSDCTARIQEVHTLIVHLICGVVEDAIVGSPNDGLQHQVAGEVR